MAKPTDVVKKIEALLARAADPGASEEERRTSAVIAARLMREHKIGLGHASAPPTQETTHTRVSVAIDGVRSVVDVVTAGRAGLDKALGFDVFAFAQNLLRERVQAELQGAIKASAPAPRAPAVKRARARRAAKRKP